jgi:ATP-dependent helicase/nuclease subunit B
LAAVTILYGPPGVGKSRNVLKRYQAHVEEHGEASALLLLPHPRAVRVARQALLAAGKPAALVAPLIMTFPELASRLLDENGETATEVSPVTQRLILREAIRRVREEHGLGFLEPVVQFDGTLDVVADFIDELKRGAIDVDAFEKGLSQARFSSGRDQDILRIYKQYQALLHELNLFDPAGRFWWARDVLQSGRRRPFEHVNLLLVDGFDDFTPTQLQVLRLLAAGAEEVVFAIGLDAGDRREDLFQLPSQTVKRLQEVFSNAKLESLQERQYDGSPLALLRAGLFADTVEGRLPEGAVQVIEAPSRVGEVREIAREAKRLLLDPSLRCSPGDMALVFRSLSEYATLLRQTFAEFGIPLHVAYPQPMACTPLGQIALQMVRLVADDFPREPFVSFLRFGLVNPEGLDKKKVDQLDLLARAAGVIGGAEQWGERLQAHRRRLERLRDEPAAEDPERAETRAAEADRDLKTLDPCVQIVEQTIAELRKLEGSRSLRQWLDVLRKLMEHFRVGRFDVDSDTAPEQAQWFTSPAGRAELLALDALLDALDAMAFAGAAVAGDADLTLSELLSLLEDALQAATFNPDGRDEGKVLALEAHDARQLHFRFVFIGGLLEREFPRQQRESQLYRDDERRTLAQHGVSLKQRLERQSEEMHLFYQAATRATERLYLTYPATDGEGREALPSHYVAAVQALCGADGPKTRRVSPSRACVPLADAYTPRELFEATWEGLWGRGDARERPEKALLLAAYNILVDRLPATAAGAAWGAYVEARRDSREPFDQYDGVLLDTAIVADLRERFGPDHRFSPSALSDYGCCPFRFFAARVLGLAALEEPVEALEALERGELYHEVLRRFFAGAQDNGDSGARDAWARMEEAVEAVFGEAAERSVATSAALLEIEREECKRSMEWFLVQEAKDFARRAPVLLEATFGDKPQDQPLQLGEGDEMVLVRGRIDRVDVIADLKEATERGQPDLLVAVMDYKVGKGPSKNAIEAGTDLQLPLYALAAERMLFPGRVVRCEAWTYRKVSRPVGLNGEVTKADAVRALKQTAVEHALRFAADIRAGRFPAVPRTDCCRHCEFRSLCRYEQWRAERKSNAGEGNG